MLVMKADTPEEMLEEVRKLLAEDERQYAHAYLAPENNKRQRDLEFAKRMAIAGFRKKLDGVVIERSQP
jgi:hypothetical protein